MCNTNIYKYIIAILSIITGIIAGVLFYTGTLTNIISIVPFFALIAAIVLTFIIVLLLIPLNRKKPLSKCLCMYSKIIVFAGILTISLVLLTLSVELVATSILSAILIGAVVAAIVGVLLGLLFFIYCLINKKCGFSNSNNNCNCCCCCCNNNTANNSTVDSCGFDLE